MAQIEGLNWKKMLATGLFGAQIVFWSSWKICFFSKDRASNGRTVLFSFRFRSIPVNVLQGQYFFIDSLKIANNSIRDIPNDANILVNIKEIDISFNPLSKDSVVNMLGEPKTVHKLNMAGTGIKVVPSLETPFLTHLNLSHNDISVLNEDILSKSSLISLDVSHNQIPNLSSGLSSR